MNKQLAFVTTWVVGVASVFIGGLASDEYRRHVIGLSGPQLYPKHDVWRFVLVVTVETAALWLIIRPHSYRGSWGRALTAALLIVPITLYFGMALMHAPWYQYAHFIWSVLVSIALLVALAAAVIRP